MREADRHGGGGIAGIGTLPSGVARGLGGRLQLRKCAGDLIRSQNATRGVARLKRTAKQREQLLGMLGEHLHVARALGLEGEKHTH